MSGHEVKLKKNLEAQDSINTYEHSSIDPPGIVWFSIKQEDIEKEQ